MRRSWSTADAAEAVAVCQTVTWAQVTQGRQVLCTRALYLARTLQQSVPRAAAVTAGPPKWCATLQSCPVLPRAACSGPFLCFYKPSGANNSWKSLARNATNS